MTNKKKRVKSKAAQATEAMRQARGVERRPAPKRAEAEAEPVESVEYKAGGLLSGMRSGFQSAVGAGPRKKSWIANVIYVLLLMALAAFIYGTAR
jgi:hypothetical protein